jgi:glycine hydroxymethyltransferase
VNKNTVPGEPRSPFVTSGLRIGTPALTTRGMGTDEMIRIGDWIADILESPADQELRSRIRSEVEELSRAFPLYPHLAEPSGVAGG